MIVMTNQTKQVTFSKHELETILYSLEGYIQGNDDIELADELVDICYKIEAQLEEVKWNLSEELVLTSLQQSKPQIDANMLK